MTENEELNTILHEIQDKIILPSYLPEKQRRIVFDPKKKQFLETNPIDIEVEGYEHRFKHINRHRDIPTTKEITDRALQAMQTREDYDNVGTLLAGLNHANQGVKSNRMAKIFRVLVNSGQVGAVIGCLKQFRQTGLVVANKEALLRLYGGLADEVDKADGNVEELQKIVRWSEIVHDVIQRPEHDAIVTPIHQDIARYVDSKLEGADEGLRQEIGPIYSAHGLKDLANSVFGRSLALYPRLALVKAKQAAGEDVEADMVQVNDEIETVTNLWHQRQPKDAETFDMGRVVETKQVCPSVNPRGNLWKWQKNTSLSDNAYLRVLARTYKALKEAELMSPTQAQGLTAVANQIPSHAAKLLQIIEKKVQAPPETKASWFKELSGIDLTAILATLPPLENHRTEMGADPALLRTPAKAELEEGSATEEVAVGDGR